MTTLRKLFTFIVKLGLAGLLIWWLLRSDRLDAGVLRGIVFDTRTVGLVLAGVASVFAGLALLAIRLRALVRVQALDLTGGRAFGLTMIGAFFGSVLPGLVSGDAVKALYLCGDVAHTRTRMVAAVLVDRLIGLFSLFLLGSLALLVAVPAKLLPTGATVLYLAPVVVVAMAAGLALVGWPVLDPLIARLPSALGSMIAAIRQYLHRPRLLGIAVALSLANHALVIVTYLIGGLLLQDSLTPLRHFVIDPLAMVMNVIPLTPGGIGITEGAFSFLFEQMDSPNGAAVGLVGRAIQYIAYVAGGSIALMAVRFRRGGG